MSSPFARQRSGRRGARWAALLGVWLLTLSGVPAPTSAQDVSDVKGARDAKDSKDAPAAAVLLATAGGHRSGKALDSVVGAAVDEIEAVNVVARPGLDLGAVQLALDCVGETAQCLRMVTSQHEAQVLIAPSLARTANEIVLTLVRFDARTGKTHRVVRRQPGYNLTSTTLDSVPQLMRELFGVPEPKPEPTPAVAAGPTQSPEAKETVQSAALSTAPGYEPAREVDPLPEPPMEAPGASRGAPLGPLLLGGGGLLMLGTGLVMGLTVMSAQDDYDELTQPRVLQELEPAQQEANVNEALDRQQTGETNSTIANVFYSLGGAAMIASGIWLAVELSERSQRYDDHVRLSPMLGRHEVGFTLTHHGAGL